MYGPPNMYHVFSPWHLLFISRASLVDLWISIYLQSFRLLFGVLFGSHIDFLLCASRSLSLRMSKEYKRMKTMDRRYTWNLYLSSCQLASILDHISLIAWISRRILPFCLANSAGTLGLTRIKALDLYLKQIERRCLSVLRRDLLPSKECIFIRDQELLQRRMSNYEYYFLIVSLLNYFRIFRHFQ